MAKKLLNERICLLLLDLLLKLGFRGSQVHQYTDSDPPLIDSEYSAAYALAFSDEIDLEQ